MTSPTELTFGQELLKLLPIVAGAILAILGGAGTQFLIHRLGAERERRKVLREKGETLVKALHAHADWIGDRLTTMVFENEDHTVPNPLNEAWTIQQIYFPQLGASLVQVLGSGRPLTRWIADERIKRMKDQASWLKAFDRAPFDTMYQQHLKVLYAAGDEAAKIVRENLQS
jgi:hypothetical protein